MIRVAIDPNVRIRGNITFSGLDEVEGGEPRLGEEVQVYEPESQMVGHGRVEEIDLDKGLVYISVEWKTFAVQRGGVSAGR